MEIGCLLALKQFARHRDDVFRLDYLAGAIDDLIVAAIGSDQHIFPAREHGWQLNGSWMTFAWVSAQEDRPKLSERLSAWKRAVGQDKHLMALRNIPEAVTAWITNAVRNADFRYVTVCIRPTGLQGTNRLGRQCCKIQIHSDNLHLVRKTSCTVASRERHRNPNLAKLLHPNRQENGVPAQEEGLTGIVVEAPHE
jgi:hypothetical protein